MKGEVKFDKKIGTYYWVVDVGTNGTRKQMKRRFKTKKEAEEALIEINHTLNKGAFFEPSKMLYKDYLEQWFTTKQKTIGVQTAKVYKDYLNGRIIPGLGIFNISKLSPIQLQAFIDNLSDQGLSSATVKKIYNIIRNSLEYAVDFELISKNPAEKIKLPKASHKEMTVWNEDEVNRFLDLAKEDPLFIVFHLALSTGMRQGEILGLRWRDVNFEKGLLRIQQTLSHDGKSFLSGAKTKSSQRNVDITEKTLNLLGKLKRLRSKEKLRLGPAYEDNDLVACTQHGTPLNPANVRRSLSRLINNADVPKIRFHDLRHCHASLLLSKGVHPKIISERLGHSSIKITLDTYSHLLPTMQAEAIRKLDEIIK